jgi:hypothetical protein
MTEQQIMVLVTAVLALVNGEIASPIIAWIKAKLGASWSSGVKAAILSIAEIAAVTAGYLIFVTRNFTLGTFGLCVLYAFARASGIYTAKKNGVSKP